MCRVARTLLLALLLTLLAAVPPAGATLFDTFLFGVDMDQVGLPVELRRTEPGFESVTMCTPYGGAAFPACVIAGVGFGPNEGNPHAGYLVDQRPLVDEHFFPNEADREDLWSDAHRAGPQGATLRIGELRPGEYRVVVLAHHAGGSPIESTCVSINGRADGCVQNIPDEVLEVGVSQSLVVDLVGDRAVKDGFIDIFFEPEPGGGMGGWVNGVLIFVPEPSTVVLLGVGLAGAIALRARRPRRRR